MPNVSNARAHRGAKNVIPVPQPPTHTNLYYGDGTASTFVFQDSTNAIRFSATSSAYYVQFGNGTVTAAQIPNGDIIDGTGPEIGPGWIDVTGYDRLSIIAAAGVNVSMHEVQLT